MKAGPAPQFHSPVRPAAPESGLLRFGLCRFNTHVRESRNSSPGRSRYISLRILRKMYIAANWPAPMRWSGCSLNA